MALSGSVKTSTYDGRCVQLSWTASQSVSNNTSTISWTLKGAGSASAAWYMSGNFSVTIDGASVYSTSASNRIKLYNGTTIASGKKTLTHGSDGKKSFKVELKAAIYNSAQNCTGSQTFTLDTIPRASTLKYSDGTMGTAMNLTVTRASNSFKHNLVCKFGSQSDTIATNSTQTSFSYTPPLSMASQIPNRTTGSGTFVLTTLDSSGRTIGSKTYWFKLSAPSSMVPSISSVTATEATSGIASKFGAYIQNKSTLKIAISATGIQGSTISSYSVSFDGKTYSGNNCTTSVPESSGTKNIVATVTDSRGRTASQSISVSITAYTQPQITKLTAFRCDSSGKADENGTYTNIQYAYAITALSNKNDKNVKIQYKKHSASIWTSLQTLTDYSSTSSYKTNVLSFDYQYDIKLTVTDYFTTSEMTATLPSAAVLLDLLSSGDGIGIGKTAESKDLLDVDWNINAKNINASGNITSKGTITASGEISTKNFTVPLIQYGNTTVSVTPNKQSQFTITFPKAFPSTPTVVFTARHVSTAIKIYYHLDTVTTTNFKGIIYTDTNGTHNSIGVHWIAMCQ